MVDLMDRRRMKQATRRYSALLASVSRCLYDEDPQSMGSRISAPLDEYLPEAGIILPELSRCTSRQDVAALMSRWYADVGAKLTDRLWELVTAYNAVQDPDGDAY